MDGDKSGRNMKRVSRSANGEWERAASGQTHRGARKTLDTPPKIIEHIASDVSAGILRATAANISAYVPAHMSMGEQRLRRQALLLFSKHVERA